MSQETFEEVAPGVIVLHGRYAEECRSIVCGREWAVLVDVPQHFDEAEQLRSCAEARCRDGVRMAILTHGHLDHTATLQDFPLYAVVATWQARDYMQHKGQQELDRMQQDDEELQQVRLVLPTVTSNGEITLFDDTGRRLRCIPAPGHSAGSQLVFLEPERILFTGDTLSSVIPPYFPDCGSVELQESLGKIAGIGAEIAVPGHGPVMRGPDIVHQAADAITYLENLRHLVRRGLEAGGSVDDLQRRIAWEDCSPRPRPPDQYLKYHHENICRMVEEQAQYLQVRKAA